jgi:hypothetical protein
MTDPAPPELTPHDIVPTVRDRRIVWTAAASVLLHAVVVGWLLFPALREAAEAAPPPAIAVELVPEPVSSSEAASASEAASSEMPSSIEASSSEPAVSGESSAEQVSSSEATSSEPASHEPSSAASSEVASSEAGAASESPSSAAASSQQPVTPMERSVVIPVGPSEASSEPDSSLEDTSSASASASEEPSTAEASSAEASSATASSPSEAVLTADTPDASEGIAEDPSAMSASSEAVAALAPPPPNDSMLHAAKRYYLDAMLNSPNLAGAREALKKLPAAVRMKKTCNIEAFGQIDNAGRNFVALGVYPDVFADVVVSGTTVSASNGVFRSGTRWYSLAYRCTLSKDLTEVTDFSFHIGGDVTDAIKAKLTSK